MTRFADMHSPRFRQVADRAAVRRYAVRPQILDTADGDESSDEEATVATIEELESTGLESRPSSPLGAVRLTGKAAAMARMLLQQKAERQAEEATRAASIATQEVLVEEKTEAQELAAQLLLKKLGIIDRLKALARANGIPEHAIEDACVP